MTETQIRMFKIVLLGDSGVGKTTLLNRYIHDSYLPGSGVTVGAELQISNVEIEPGVCVKLRIWDTCGLESFRKIIKVYTRGTDGCLLVFDLTDPLSFENIKHHFTLVPESAQCVLVGHKSDLKDRCVSREEAEELAKELGVPYVEESSVTGHNVKELFETLVRQIYRKIPNTKYEKRVVKSRDGLPKEEPGASRSCLLM